MPARPSRRGSSSRGQRPDRKTLQLCAQVRRTLESVISGEIDDDVLRMLYVAAVTPAPDAGHLLVTVTPATPGTVLDPAAVITKLHAVSGKLRSEVATTISRRKAPDLLYQFAETDPAIAGIEPRDTTEEE